MQSFAFLPPPHVSSSKHSSPIKPSIALNATTTDRSFDDKLPSDTLIINKPLHQTNSLDHNPSDDSIKTDRMSTGVHRSSRSILRPSSAESSIDRSSDHECSTKCKKRLTKEYSDGSKYDGEICTRNYLRNGEGLFINRHKDRYQGQWKNDLRHGRGIYEWHSGDRYEGSWRDGSMNGFGRFVWANGEEYTGHWHRGRMHGFGTKTEKNGDVYTGEWRYDKAHGKGCKKFSHGDYHEGNYYNDRRHGYGVYVWISGDRYEGEWADGKVNGRGKKILKNGDSYDGEWLNDKVHGYGIKTFANGDRHEGEFRDDRRTGYGIYYWTKGDRYEGGWFDGVQKGKGTYYYANGDVYKGYWFDNKKHGKGIYSCPSLYQSYMERWDNGIRIERIPCEYYPPEKLRTTKQQYEKHIEVTQIKNEIDRLKTKLSTMAQSHAALAAQVQQTMNVGSIAASTHGGGAMPPPSAPIHNINNNNNCHISSSSSSPNTHHHHNHHQRSPSQPSINSERMIISSPNHPIQSAVATAASACRSLPFTTPIIPPMSSDPSIPLSIDHNHHHHQQQRRDSVALSENAMNVSAGDSDELKIDAILDSSMASSTDVSREHTADESSCKVCYASSINTVFIRCGHMCSCMQCAMKLDKCPICRQEIEEIIQTYRV